VFYRDHLLGIDILEGSLLMFVCLLANASVYSLLQKSTNIGSNVGLFLRGILLFVPFWILTLICSELSEQHEWLSFLDVDLIVILYSLMLLFPQAQKSLLIFLLRHQKDDDSVEHSMHRILLCLYQEEKYFNQIRKELRMGGGQLRRNLDRLISTGKISTQIRGKKHYYTLTEPTVPT